MRDDVQRNDVNCCEEIRYAMRYKETELDVNLRKDQKYVFREMTR